VITMVIFMMKTGRKLKGQIEGKVGLLAGNDAWIGLFFFVFLMVLREGAETVLDSFRRLFEFHGVDELSGNANGRSVRHRFRSDVREGQRAD